MTSQNTESPHIPLSPVPAPRRLYEFWPGNNQFLFGGRVLLGPRADRSCVIATWTVLFLCQTAFSVFVTPYLWRNVSEWLPVLSWYFFLCTVTFLLMTSLSDPGILPRRKICELIRLDSNIEGDTSYCKECEIFRPVSTQHCQRCNNCILELDHHCPFLGACIGKNNYRYFIAGLVSVGLLGITDVSCISIYILSAWTSGIHPKRVRNLYTVVQDDAVMWSIIITVGGLIIVLTTFVTLLCLFHLRVWVKSDGRTGGWCTQGKSMVPWRALVQTT